MAKDEISQEDLDFLKDQIKYHFRSVAAFIRASNLDYRGTLMALKYQDYSRVSYDRINNAYKKYKLDNEYPARIHPNVQQKIRLCILTNFKSYTEFCKKHKDFDVVYISNIVNNRLKLRSSKYVQLIDVLERRYGLVVE